MLLSFGRSAPSRRNLGIVLLSAFALAGCNSFGGGESAGSTGNAVTNAVFGAPNPSTNNAIVVSAENFGVQMNECPPILIRPGTEVMVAYAVGKKVNEELGEKPAIQYQSSIVNTARECRRVEGGVQVKIGIKGRTVAGPAGKAGTQQLPLRIVVIQGTETIVKSDLYKIPVTLQEPEMSANFTKIDETIVLPIAPGNTDFRIYVGFDETLGKKAKG